MFSSHRKYGNNWDIKIVLHLFLFFYMSTGSAGICLSQRKVRQIDDPNQRLLELLHKIIFITQVIWRLFSDIFQIFSISIINIFCFQLPPAPQNSFKQRAIERFKKPLFSYGSDPYNLKVELNKVLHLIYIMQQHHFCVCCLVLTLLSTIS